MHCTGHWHGCIYAAPEWHLKERAEWILLVNQISWFRETSKKGSRVLTNYVVYPKQKFDPHTLALR